MKTYRILTLFVFFIVSACATIPTTSRFTRESVGLGMNKSTLINKMGTPFSADSYMEDNKHIDILYYKEAVRVKNCPYIITTTLYFENELLRRITQKDKYISDNNKININSDIIKE